MDFIKIWHTESRVQKSRSFSLMAEIPCTSVMIRERIPQRNFKENSDFSLLMTHHHFQFKVHIVVSSNVIQGLCKDGRCVGLSVPGLTLCLSH